LTTKLQPTVIKWWSRELVVALVAMEVVIKVLLSLKER